MKQTAVQWLDRWFRDNSEATYEEGNKALEQAMQMEKQQIIDAYGDEQSHLQDDGSWLRVTAEQYYNETFNK